MTRWMRSRPAHDPMCGRSVRPQTLPRPAHQTRWWSTGTGSGGLWCPVQMFEQPAAYRTTTCSPSPSPRRMTPGGGGRMGCRHRRRRQRRPRADRTLERPSVGKRQPLLWRSSAELSAGSDEPLCQRPMGDGRQTPPTTERADGPLGWLPLEYRTQSQRLTRSSHNAALRRRMGCWQHRQPPENPRNALQACTSARQRRRSTRPVSLARTPPLTSTRTRRRRPADRRPPTRHGQARSRRPCPGRSHPRTRHRG